MAREEAVARTAETASAEFGRFDTWVNNAVVSVFGKTTQMTMEGFHRVFDVVFGAWCTTVGRRWRSRADGDGPGRSGRERRQPVR